MRRGKDTQTTSSAYHEEKKMSKEEAKVEWFKTALSTVQQSTRRQGILYMFYFTDEKYGLTAGSR